MQKGFLQKGPIQDMRTYDFDIIEGYDDDDYDYDDEMHDEVEFW